MDMKYRNGSHTKYKIKHSYTDDSELSCKRHLCGVLIEELITLN